MPLDDRIDVGVFSATKEHLKPLDFAKRHLTERETTFTFVVNQSPTWAGIDPYNRLIDRNPEDNLIAVERK
jgi:ABC-2 type transport system permease protein